MQGVKGFVVCCVLVFVSQFFSLIDLSFAWGVGVSHDHVWL